LFSHVKVFPIYSFVVVDARLNIITAITFFRLCLAVVDVPEERLDPCWCSLQRRHCMVLSTAERLKKQLIKVQQFPLYLVLDNTKKSEVAAEKCRSKDEIVGVMPAEKQPLQI
jgi:hypothetical protein